jgi:DNA-binding SARP family transcriptional activator/TolB-like protein
MDRSSQRVTRFRAFGVAELKGPAGTDPQSLLARPKLLGLLAYLAAATPRGLQRRDTIAGLLWGELSQERARGALRQSLYHLRQFLGEGVIVTRGDEEVGLDSDLSWCDVTAFENALESGAREEALDFYRGDFLHGFYVTGAPEFERWLDERRVELRERARVAAWELAQGAEAEGNAADAARWARQAMKLAPFDEDLVRQVIELLGRMGDRSGAVREYEAFATRLAEEWELEPAEETRMLIDRVRASRGPQKEGDTADERAGVSAAPAAVAPSTPESSTPSGAGVGTGGRLLGTRAFRLGLVAGAALVVGLGIVWAFGFREDTEQPLDPLRVVVAVFDNQTGDPDLDPLGRMAADWATEGLNQIEVVDVVPSTTGLVPRPGSASAAVSTPDDVRALAEATGAGTVVMGAYYRSGDSIRFQAQVLDARDGQLLSALDPVAGPAEASGAIVDTLRQRVVGTIATLLDSRVGPPLAGGAPPSLEAYRAYLEGHRIFHRSQAELAEALRYFYQAVALDSSFITPRMYIVFAHGTRREWQAADSNAQLLVPHRSRMNDYQRATLDWMLAQGRGDRMAALRATRARGGLDVGVEAVKANHPQEAVDALANTPSLPDWYYHWLTLIEAYHMLGDYPNELIEARRGRAANPERLRMLEAEVRAMIVLGDIDGVRERLDESLLLSSDDGLMPGALMANAAAELRTHGYQAVSFEVADRAIEWYRTRPPREQATGQYRFELATAYYLRERWDESRVLFEELAAEVPANVNIQGFLGVLAARRGDAETALSISQGLTGMAERRDFGRDTYWQACIASLLGEPERAMVLLRSAYEQGREFTIVLHRDMDLEPLRDHLEYLRFIEPKG